jgi:hypothetical protein
MSESCQHYKKWDENQNILSLPFAMRCSLPSWVSSSKQSIPDAAPRIEIIFFFKIYPVCGTVLLATENRTGHMYC